MNVSDDNFYSSDLNSSGSISVYSFISSSNDSSNSPSVLEPSESDSKGLISGIKWESDGYHKVTSDLEDALEEQNWSSLYDMSDANEAVSLIIGNVEAALDIVAPLIPITFRPDKPKISLSCFNLAIFSTQTSMLERSK